jgi:hypothetical protein
MYVNSRKFRDVVGGHGEWEECNNINRFISVLSAQYNYGHLFADLLNRDFPVLVYSGD